MKTISGGLTTHINQTVTTLAMLWRITRTDGTEFFFTTHDESILFSGDTYVPTGGFSPTAIDTNDQMNVDNLDVTGYFEASGIQEDELRAGLFDFAEVRISLVNYTDLAQGELKARRGWLGETVASTDGIFKAELRGMAQALQQQIVEIYQPECRADLGDARCKVPILAGSNDTPSTEIQRNTAVTLGQFFAVPTAVDTGQPQYENRIYEVTTAGTTAASQPTYDTIIGNTTTDGTAVLTARDAFVRHAVVATVTDRRTFTITVTEARAVDDWFNGGAVIFETGPNAGKALEIKDWVNSTSTVTLFLPAPQDITATEELRIYPGCDKRRTTCRNRFVIAGSAEFANGNVKNFRGEPDLPGIDDLVNYAPPRL